MGRQESPLLKLCSSLDSEHSGPSTLGEHVRDYSVWPEQSWCPPEGLPGPEARAGSVLRASVGAMGALYCLHLLGCSLHPGGLGVWRQRPAS